jgi:HAD superfamily hydrolase (TIGR01549 family)
MTDTQSLNFSHITTVIFDMDGTLIEHTWQLSQITEALFARFADKLAPVSHNEFYDLFWSKNEDMWYMMVDGVLDGDTAAKYSYINTLHALGKDTALAEPMLAYWHQLVLEEARPFEDTFTVLTALRDKYATGIVTNGFATLQRAKINRYHLAEYVDFILVSEEAGFHKPDKRIFLKALEMAGNASAQQTLYIGDNPISDIQGAQQIGIIPLFINPRNDLDAPNGVAEIQKLSDLLKLLGLKIN